MRGVGSVLRASPLGIRRRRVAYESDLAPDAARAPDPGAAREVIERGICLIESYVDQSELDVIRDHVVPALEETARALRQVRTVLIAR